MKHRWPILALALAGGFSSTTPVFAASEAPSPAATALSPEASPVLACRQNEPTPVLHCAARNDLLWARPNAQNAVRKMAQKSIVNRGGVPSTALYFFAGLAAAAGTALSSGGHNSVSP